MSNLGIELGELIDLLSIGHEAVFTLDEKERDVIFERYFANPDKLTTYEEISKKLGFSKQRVQQLEKRAIDKLKHSKEMLNYKKNFSM